MGNAYPAEYLSKHEVREETFKDREQTLAYAKKLRQDGFKVKTTRICPFGEYIWTVEGIKTRG